MREIQRPPTEKAPRSSRGYPQTPSSVGGRCIGAGLIALASAVRFCYFWANRLCGHAFRVLVNKDQRQWIRYPLKPV